MQTFLPLPDFAETAHILDRQRLGKQRIEAMQLLRTNLQGGGWSYHPAAKMWRGYEAALAAYALTICDEWIGRGYQDSCREKTLDLCNSNGLKLGVEWRCLLPSWLGCESFHRSHQSNLVRKFSEYYRPFFPDVPDDLPYVWPTKEPA